MKITEQLIGSPYPHTTDKHLGEREIVHAETVCSSFRQKFDRALVIRIATIEEGDDHTRIEDDHSGQSLRSPVR